MCHVPIGLSGHSLLSCIVYHVLPSLNSNFLLDRMFASKSIFLPFFMATVFWKVGTRTITLKSELSHFLCTWVCNVLA